MLEMALTMLVIPVGTSQKVLSFSLFGSNKSSTATWVKEVTFKSLWVKVIGLSAAIA
jgi:hypothetical protein